MKESERREEGGSKRNINRRGVKMEECRRGRKGIPNVSRKEEREY